jgi:hypothetical protein
MNEHLLTRQELEAWQQRTAERRAQLEALQPEMQGNAWERQVWKQAIHEVEESELCAMLALAMLDAAECGPRFGRWWE